MTGEEKRESGVSRREALQTGTFATAGLLGLSSLGSDSATAQSSEPRIRLGDEWVIDPDGDDFSIEHSSLGVSFVWDESAGHWVPGGGGFDMDGEDIVDNGTTVYDASTDTVGDGSTSADHQSVDTDELSVNNFGARVGIGTAQTVSDSTFETIEYSNEIYDDQNEWDSSTHQFTASEGGLYLYFSRISFESVPDQTLVFLRSQVNGSDYDKDREQMSGSGNATVSLSGVADLSSGDTLGVEVLQTSGGSLDTLSNLEDCNIVVGKIA
jgi:hypothetical protein